MQSGQGEPGALGQAAYGDVHRLEKRVAALEHREQRDARRAKPLFWLDTYNAALTGLLANDVNPTASEALTKVATAIANELHGKQS